MSRVPPAPAHSNDNEGLGDRSKRFLALGDSYTIGQEVEPSDRWPVQLASLLRQEGVEIEPTILAMTGWTTFELLAALVEAELQPPYDLVSLLIGVNNQYRGLSEEGYRQELRVLLLRAVALADNRPGRILVLSIPDWSATPFAARAAEQGGREVGAVQAEIDRFNATLRVETTELGLRYVDITPLSREVSGNGALLASDELHFSGQMYARWARLVLPIARQALD